ncbi:MAG: DNA-binding domain-containing protein [Proteobacteria bacterium]|nr:DNA-binding domain-containing protein [Pseudomonadota bacterium]
MQADWTQLAGSFSQALLRPDLPVPEGASAHLPKRFAVYRNNVTLSLVEALEANFPALRRLLGGEAFLALALDHVRRCPPVSKLLFEYGRDLAPEIEGDAALAAYPYLADVARLERLWLDSFHEADALPLPGSALAQVAADELGSVRFVAHPAMRLMNSRFAVVSIFARSRTGEGLDGLDLSQPEFGLVSRPGLMVDVRRVSGGTFAFLNTLSCGATLGLAAEEGARVDVDFDLGAALMLAIEAGAFTRIKTGEEA